jgi:hypothetical protein
MACIALQFADGKADPRSISLSGRKLCVAGLSAPSRRCYRSDKARWHLQVRILTWSTWNKERVKPESVNPNASSYVVSETLLGNLLRRKPS